MVNFVPAVAYHFCLYLPAAFTQPGDHLLAEPCTDRRRVCVGPPTDLGVSQQREQLAGSLVIAPNDNGPPGMEATMRLQSRDERDSGPG